MGDWLGNFSNGTSRMLVCEAKSSSDSTFRVVGDDGVALAGCGSSRFTTHAPEAEPACKARGDGAPQGGRAAAQPQASRLPESAQALCIDGDESSSGKRKYEMLGFADQRFA